MVINLIKYANREPRYCTPDTLKDGQIGIIRRAKIQTLLHRLVVQDVDGGMIYLDNSDEVTPYGSIESIEILETGDRVEFIVE